MEIKEIKDESERDPNYDYVKIKARDWDHARAEFANLHPWNCAPRIYRQGDVYHFAYNWHRVMP